MPPTSPTGEPATSHEQGFTLVEVLVALSILAMVGLALVAFQSFQANGTVRLKAETLAQIEADNRAIDLLLQPAAPTGPTSGVNANGGLPLAHEITPGPSPLPDAFPALVTVDVRVRAEGGGAVLASRRIVRTR